MKFTRRTFLKTSGTLLASLLAGGRVDPVQGEQLPSILPGREVSGRCPLCSLGCGVIYRSRGLDQWYVEGDPDCPTASGSLCSRGAGLVDTLRTADKPIPLYRRPGGSTFEEISWDAAIHLMARRLKDLRDRDLGFFSADGEKVSNRFDSLGVIAGGCLTNEEAYLTSKLFRALGVSGMDTTVRASHGMAVSGLLDTFGFPGGTHPVAQIAYSDVVVLLGCNPGQTAPAVCRFLDRVRERRGTVIVVDPRWSETVKKGDLWLQIRPGTDHAVLGAIMNWILQYAEIQEKELVEHSDAAYIVMSEIMGEYERHRSGKYKNWIRIDNTFSEPYSIFQRMKKHYNRFDLKKVAGITGVDIHLLRRACTLISRTASRNFAATFVAGSGALANPSGVNTMRTISGIQAVLGNLDKKGGGVVIPSAAGNAQGVCDMGLLAPYLPGYLHLPVFGENIERYDHLKPLNAILRAWYPQTSQEKALSFIPHIEADENPSVSTIIQGIADEQYRAVVVIGSNPRKSMPDNSSILSVLERLDLLVVMDSTVNSTCTFWKNFKGMESTIKTEVLFIPVQPPVLKSGSMTDTGRRVRVVRPVEISSRSNPGLLEFMVDLGNSIRSKYKTEGGILAEPILDLSWPLNQEPEDVQAEINGFRSGPNQETALPAGRTWEKEDRCGNHLYRGWISGEDRLSERKDNSDPYGLGLYENWGWSWPWGITDPFSWIAEPNSTEGVSLRRLEQKGERKKAADVLPLRSQLAVKFWKLVEKGSPFPEHYEPFHSPLPDFLTGGRSNPNLHLRREIGNKWGYLSRRPEEILGDYNVIITLHRTGHIMGTGGITARLEHARELGVCRIAEIGRALAKSLRIRDGDKLVVFSPYSSDGIQATAHVTGRVGSFYREGVYYHVASLTLYGSDDKGVNALTPPAFDFLTGGIEVKTFMGRIEKA